MPAVIKLSKLFYERFGEQLANELVEVFNQVGATYRADLRDFNEMNFARFDATLRQGLAEFNLKFEQRLTALSARLDAVEARLDGKIDALDARLSARIDTLPTRAELEKGLREQTRLLFLAWATLMAAILFRG